MTVLFAIFVYTIVDAFYNFGVIKWGEGLTNGEAGRDAVKRYSQVWHFYGAVKFLWVILSIYFFKTSIPFFWVVAWACWIRWFFFDLILNLLRKKPAFYVGYTAMIDRIYRKTPYPEFFMALTKILIAVLLVVLWKYQPWIF